MPAQPKPLPQGDFNKTSILETVAGADGGVNSYVQPYYLEENQLSYLKNADLDVPGLRRKRYGCQAEGGATTSTPQGMGVWRAEKGTRHILAAWDGAIYHSTGDLSWTDVVPGNSQISLVPSFYNLIQGSGYWTTSGVTLLDYIIFANGVDYWTGATLPALYMVQEENGYFTNNASLCPRAMTWWQGRLWLGNLTSDDFGPNTLLWSDLWDGTTFNTNNYISVDEVSGDEIMAIAPTRGTQPRLYIFKKHRIYALDVVWGDGVYVPATENTLDTQNSRLSIVSEDVGCVAPKTIVYTSGSGDSDVFFLAADGVRSLRRVEQDVAGGAGEPISSPVQDVIDRINWAAVLGAVATIFDHKLFLSIPVDGETTNNTMLVFDLTKKIWVGEYSLGVKDMLAWDYNNQAVKLYGQWPVQTTETLSGIGATAAAHVFQLLAEDSYYDPSLTSIEYEEQTKSFVFGDFGVKKRWDYLEVMFEPATTNATVSIAVKVDEGDWTTLENIAVTPHYEYPVLPAKLPWNLETAAAQIEYLHGLHDAPPGRRIQYKFTTSSPARLGIRLLRTKAWHYPEKWE